MFETVLDIKKANDDFCEFMEEQGMCDDFDFPEDDFNFPVHDYMRFNCPECGAPLEVYTDYLVEERPAEFDGFKYEKRDLIRHCSNCHRDWENEWCTENGDVSESQLKRKYWG